MRQLLFALWFFLPGGIANAVPPLANHIPGLRALNQPVDFGRSFRGKRIFGEHKTWRGIVCGTLAGGLVAALLYSLMHKAFLQPFTIAPGLLGALMGFGALAGDAIESFFKRQIGVKPGSSWFPFDQIDYILGGLIAVSPFTHLEWSDYFLIILLWFGMHLLFSYIGYLLKLKSQPI